MMNGKVPDWFYATTFWLIANREMENPASAGFEAHAWYPYWKAGGVQCVTDMKALPKKNRLFGPVVPPVIPDVTLAERAKLLSTTDMQTYPWGDKFAFAHGMIPFGRQIFFTYSNEHWFVRPAFRLSDGKTVLILFKEGHYTDGETTVLEWSL
jgi:hypothetical protein